MWLPNGHWHRPQSRPAASSRVTPAILNLTKVAGDQGPPSPSASGWIERAELSIRGIAWCLARATRRIATKFRFVGGPSGPTRLTVRADGLGMVRRARRNGVRVGNRSGADITREASTRPGGPISCTGVVERSRPTNALVNILMQRRNERRLFGLNHRTQDSCFTLQ